MYALTILLLIQLLNGEIWAQNDSQIESTNNCKCVLYYLCDGDNYINTAGVGVIDVRLGVDRIPCTNSNYWCCYLRSNTTNSTDIEPKSPIFTEQLNCGQQLPYFDVRIKSPNTNTALIGEIPWILAILQKRDESYRFRCAGSLIHPKVVLTAAHYLTSIKANVLKVMASGSTLGQSIGPVEDYERKVIKIIKHPDYYSGGLFNDIGLLILDKPYNLTKSSTLNTICLPTTNQRYSKCRVAGWGTEGDQDDRILRTIDLPLVEFASCQDLLRKTRLGAEFLLDESFMCAGGEAGKDACTGDGGGPLMCVDDERKEYVQIGIVSWGVGCGQANVPGIYTNVLRFTKWINEVLTNEMII